MTGREIYKAALAILSQQEGDNDRWDSLAVEWINHLVSEIWTEEQALRAFYNESQSVVPVRIDDLDKVLKVHEEMRPALVDGMAAILWEDADEAYKAQDFRGRMADALMSTTRLRAEKVVDVY